MNIRKARAKDKDEFMKLASYSFSENPHADSGIWWDLFDAKQTTVIEEDGKIVGGYILIPHEISYGNDLAKMGGVSTVVVHPSCRGRGYAKKMLSKMIEDLNEEGYVFTALGAFLFSFYRSLGWELSYDSYSLKTDIYALEEFSGEGHSFDIHYEVPLDLISEAGNKYFSKISGAVVRSKDILKRAKKMYDSMKYMTCTAKNDNGNFGYMIYKMNGDVITVDELVWEDASTLKALLSFVYRHNSQRERIVINTPSDKMIYMLLSEPDRQVNIKAGMMNRIINVKKAFEMGAYPKNINTSVVLEVEDKQADWNNGIWELQLSSGNMTAIKSDKDIKTDAKMSIQALSQMILGYASGENILKLNKAQALTESGQEFITQAFKEKLTYMNERF